MLIVVASLVTWLVLWDRSDIKNTALDTGPANVTAPAVPSTFPPSLAEVWQQPSTATPIPVVAGPNIVTAAGGSVVGRDPLTGDARWSYTRDLPLCSVNTAWGETLAVYHRSNCNEVTELNNVTGARGAQRNGDAQLGMQMLSDGIYVTTTGTTLLNTWRSDMVQTGEYGTVPDFVNPNVQPRSDCTYSSVAVSPGLVGVIEHCPIDAGGARLTVFRADPTNEDQPEVVWSTVIGPTGTRLIAMNDQYTVTVVPTPSIHLAVFNTTNGAQAATYPLNLPASDLTGNPPNEVVPTYTGTSAVYWYTGSSTIALSANNFAPEWSVNGTLGPGTQFVGKYLVPVPNALLVVDPASGRTIGSIGVNRHGYTGPVAMSTLGPMVFEERGTVLAALR